MLKYEQFLIESNKDNLINNILQSLEQTLVLMVERIETASIAKGGMPFSNYQKEFTKLSLSYDLIKSIETYTLPSDILISLNANNSIKDNVELNAKINRGGESFYLSTEAIYAGGYNIQKLHYRYITKTNLPYTKSDVMTKSFAEKIKKMSKLQTLNLEIESNLKIINKTDEDILKNSAMTDKQILEILIKEDKYRILTKTWENIPDDADIKKDGKESFDARQKEYVNSSIAFWKRKNIKWKEDYKAATIKRNNSLHQKINSYI